MSSYWNAPEVEQIARLLTLVAAGELIRNVRLEVSGSPRWEPVATGG